MSFLVFRRAALVEKLYLFLFAENMLSVSFLRSALVEKLYLFLFAENMLSVSFLRSTPFFPPTHSIEEYMTVSYTVYTLFFSNHKLRSSSRNSGALSDTRVFGMLFLENMTLRIGFIIALFLFGA